MVEFEEFVAVMVEVIKRINLPWIHSSSACLLEDLRLLCRAKTTCQAELALKGCILTVKWDDLVKGV
jgi:hypothetical protein